jgi:hypothetical protein
VNRQSSIICIVALLLACRDGKPEEQRVAETIAAVRAESATAAAVAAKPVSSLWDVDRVSERLVRSGVAPRRIDPTPPVPPFFATAMATGAFSVGRDGELRVFIFNDSTARRAATEPLDPLTSSPRGEPIAWPRPTFEAPLLIIAQNMAAVLIGGRSTLRERVQLGLEAGLPSK